MTIFQMDDREPESVKRVAELPLVIINMLVNLIVTVALSLSIYLLMVNMFLTVYKFNMSGESMQDGISGMSYQSVTPPVAAKYYDCSTSNLLSVDECDLLNNYHARFLHSLGANLIDETTQRGDLDNTGSSNSKPSLDSLKINTSLYVS